MRPDVETVPNVTVESCAGAHSGGVAALEAEPSVGDGADRGLLDGTFQVEIGEVAHVAIAEMQVRLDEARQEGHARGVDLAGSGRSWRRLHHPAHPAENLSLDEDAGILNRRPAVPIDEQRVLDEDRTGVHSGGSRDA